MASRAFSSPRAPVGTRTVWEDDVGDAEHARRTGVLAARRNNRIEVLLLKRLPSTFEVGFVDSARAAKSSRARGAQHVDRESAIPSGANEELGFDQVLVSN